MFVALLPIWRGGGAPEVLLEGNHKLEQDGVGEGGRMEGRGGWMDCRLIKPSGPVTQTLHLFESVHFSLLPAPPSKRPI
jgi:hypothetical protein